MKSANRLTKIALAVSAVAAFSGVAHAETVKIAIAGPMTGAVAQYGDMVKAGALTAVEQINAAGGANGNKFEVVLMDDACEPKQAVAVANKIVSQGIKYVIGHVCSGSTIPASDIYENEGVVMITPSATAPQLTEAKPHKYIFRTIGRDDQQGPAAARYVIEKLKPKKVAVLHDKQSYGQGVATSVKTALDAAKVPVVLFEGINAGDSDYSAIVTKLKSQGVDFVYFGGYHPEMGLIMRQAREQGVKAVFMGPEGVGNKDITAIAGPASEGMLVTLPADFAADPANAALVKAFTAQKRDPNGPFQMPAYSGVKIIADAIAGSKSTDPTKVAAYIHANSFKTPIGTVEYDKKGDLKSFNFVVYTWHKDATKTEAK
ncbi:MULTISPECIES: branched-chain amino acid ABC transporter substrate-binding protein [unclassified Herbaspirillum]|uniref:branched-chain amino acid ABC transporter substrate-binding protein n=1 Tax=unclassified Herbaspirillum TaxID=2624150 RepID=UPI0011543ADB|nr:MULTISPECIES: branched-chain amino acid ABC transporter substrate-binding protein [unclassified Herbaspirillum]MBB5390922.1 branched-chain amino acid transport system substrate-binding protein [Herbaspirillum sp. SJZ102]TQK06446.1 L-leucine-binding protein /L-isoleucine-binding protein /L-valine-binding protein [Herbaspirillum sp. SJZ130]TQK12076.1 L-leucine-binding protein /L-isoleucine-binding protein /L-valine-binding protein [Herbaspirillum sp. SJZ106]TWC64596.1 L-leucine-binding protein